jgi:hypothetical protein
MPVLRTEREKFVATDSSITVHMDVCCSGNVYFRILASIEKRPRS